MNKPARMSISREPSSGFTLIEVIVAMAILGISLVMVMQLFSAGLRAARASCDYTIAVVHARDKMEELSETMSNDSGEFEDGFRWETEVVDHEEIEDSEYSLKQIRVRILWPDGMKEQKSMELVSLKMSSSEENL